MRKTSEATSSSPSCRSRSEKKHNLRSSKPQSNELSLITPEKPPERVRNRGVALSVSEVRKVAERLQDRKPLHATTSSQVKTARRQIVLPSPSKPKTDETVKLPEKYEILGDFFNSLVGSIRLLSLRRSTPSFTNISRSIETLTDRRFTHTHLAQLKFILPEAIVIKKFNVLDERTSCMKPDLHVSIDPDAVKSDEKLLPGCGTEPLKKLFHSRLRDFCKSHPEGDEIPEEILPEPFNHPKQDRLLDMLKTPSSSFSTETLQTNDIADNKYPASIEINLKSVEALNQQPVAVSHMSQAFRRRFSQKSKENGTDNVQQSFPSYSSQPIAFTVSESSLKKNSPSEGAKSHPNTFPTEPASEAASSEICPTTCSSPNCSSSSSAPPAAPSTTIEYTENKDESLKSIDAMSTPAKLVSTPLRLMTATPALPPPKRHYMSPDDNSTSSVNKLVRRPPRSRSLKFDSPVKNEDDAGGLSIDDDNDNLDILPESLLQSIREKERIAMEERDPAISQAKRRKKVIASLPKLFNMIHMLFHSLNRSVITKAELISKIISYHRDIVDRSEVEEQLHLLLELVPEWISEKLASSGDYLLCVNKMLNPDTIRASLEEAK